MKFISVLSSRHDTIYFHAMQAQSNLIQSKNTSLGTIFSYCAETYFQTMSNFAISSYEQIKKTIICITLWREAEWMTRNVIDHYTPKNLIPPYFPVLQGQKNIMMESYGGITQPSKFLLKEVPKQRIQQSLQILLLFIIFQTPSIQIYHVNYHKAELRAWKLYFMMSLIVLL